MSKTFAGYALAVYCTALVAGVAVLSHYPWPTATPEPERTLAQPPDFKAITDVSQRKAEFLDYLQPLIEAENQRLVDRRDELKKIREKVARGRTLTAKELRKIDEWALEYDLEQATLDIMLERLDRRIDVLPPAMVLAQAAAESAWGTSRFARLGHNYFGQWCFKQGCGLVPKRRPEGAFHEVTRFDSPQASVAAYFHNINTHSAYHSLRLLRQELTEAGEVPTAYTLVGKLSNYSERGAAYVEELRAIIRANELEGKVPAEPELTAETRPNTPG